MTRVEIPRAVDSEIRRQAEPPQSVMRMATEMMDAVAVTTRNDTVELVTRSGDNFGQWKKRDG